MFKFVLEPSGHKIIVSIITESYYVTAVSTSSDTNLVEPLYYMEVQKHFSILLRETKSAKVLARTTSPPPHARVNTPAAQLLESEKLLDPPF